MMPHKWLGVKLQEVTILQVGELLDQYYRLRVQCNNHTEILFLGSRKIKSELSDESSSTVEELHAGA